MKKEEKTLIINGNKKHNFAFCYLTTIKELFHNLILLLDITISIVFRIFSRKKENNLIVVQKEEEGFTSHQYFIDEEGILRYYALSMEKVDNSCNSKITYMELLRKLDYLGEIVTDFGTIGIRKLGNNLIILIEPDGVKAQGKFKCKIRNSIFYFEENNTSQFIVSNIETGEKIILDKKMYKKIIFANKKTVVDIYLLIEDKEKNPKFYIALDQKIPV